jgi:lysylphosphatidylglycerol synthetase-like protein (DUF2156 family)
MSNRPISCTITLAFILLNSLVWLGFGIIIAVNANPSLPVSPYIKWIMAFLSFCIAAIFIGLLIFLIKRSRIAYILTLALLGATALLSIFDDFGLADLVVVAINFIPFVLLIKDRIWYLHRMPGSLGAH